MIISIGSKNKSKIDAALIAFQHFFPEQNIQSVSKETDSYVSPQPFGFPEILEGATNRARSAYIGCDYSVGIEGGIVQLDRKTFINLAGCAVIKGANIWYGTGPGFVIPPEIMPHILEGKDLSEAAQRAGWTNETDLGAKGGLIGRLSEGKVSRQEYIIPGVLMALSSMYATK